MENARIDLNCDLGEGCQSDSQLMPLITSANIGCGFHAGGVEETFAALQLAAQHGVQVGAHPGFPDREEFGRRELSWPPERILHECLYQVGALLALANDEGCTVRYMKPHGALYNMACRDAAVAAPVIAAAVSLQLPVMGLPRSQMQQAAKGRIPFIAEGFADRRYRQDGSLTPRSQPDAFVEDPAVAVEQAQRLIANTGVRTLCVHGDNPHALAFVKALRESLRAKGLAIRAFEPDAAE
jgi:5-oxoprolinase (ATP-hydrolysing) subunit A